MSGPCGILLTFPLDEAHRETFDGAPVGLQLIGKRFREEELLSALDVIESAINV